MKLPSDFLCKQVLNCRANSQLLQSLIDKTLHQLLSYFLQLASGCLVRNASDKKMVMGSTPRPSKSKNVSCKSPVFKLEPPILFLLQNVPVSNRGPRLETVTPNRLASEFGNDGHRSSMADESGSEFRRSSSARLHRNKRNHSDIFDQIQFGQEESRRKEQVGALSFYLNLIA